MLGRGGEEKGGGGERQHLPGLYQWLMQGEGGKHVGEGRGTGGGEGVGKERAGWLLSIPATC